MTQKKSPFKNFSIAGKFFIYNVKERLEMRMKRRGNRVIVVSALVLSFVGPASAAGLNDRPRVVTSIFPLFDFARSVAGERAEVVLLLPPGTDVHTWQPRPRDIVSLSRADLFVYVGSGLEPWVDVLLKNKRVFKGCALEAGAGLPARGSHGHELPEEGKVENETPDPHVWLDFRAAEIMVLRLRDALESLDPPGAETYRRNAATTVEDLRRLDRDFREGLSRCRTRTMVLGGHAAFGRLAERYGLEQVSLYGLSPDAEPTARHMVRVVERMRKERLATVFFEVNSSRKLAEVLARETGAGLIGLDPAANPNREQTDAGATFLTIMRGNLAALRRGLGCE